MRSFMRSARPGLGVAGALAVGLVLALALTVTPARADIYSWTDAEGVIHFTNITPAGKDKAKWKKVYKTGPGKASSQRGDCARCDVVPAKGRTADRYVRYGDANREAAAPHRTPEPFLRPGCKVGSA